MRVKLKEECRFYTSYRELPYIISKSTETECKSRVTTPRNPVGPLNNDVTSELWDSPGQNHESHNDAHQCALPKMAGKCKAYTQSRSLNLLLFIRLWDFAPNHPIVARVTFLSKGTLGFPPRTERDCRVLAFGFETQS